MDRNELADKLDGMASSTFFGPDKDALRQAAAALKESEEWRRDAERMDWLERVGFSTQNPQTDGRTMNVNCYGPVNGRKWTAHYISSQFDTARAAIDAARKEGV